jgi:hypothetical protein
LQGSKSSVVLSQRTSTAQTQNLKVGKKNMSMSKYTTIDAIERMSGAFPLRNLGVNELLRQSLSSINLIEICFSQAEAFSGRVKCWRIGTMAPRWFITNLGKLSKDRIN